MTKLLLSVSLPLAAGDMPRRPGTCQGVVVLGRFYATQQVFTKPVVASATVGIVAASA